MSQLSDLQRRHVRMISLLIDWAYAHGYELTWGDAFRDPRAPYGQPNSLHMDRLAVDFNLFKDGVYLRNTEDYRPLGEIWEAMGGSWGGRFDDGNHFSLEYQGRK